MIPLPGSYSDKQMYGDRGTVEYNESVYEITSPMAVLLRSGERADMHAAE